MMKSFFKKLAFIMALAMVVSLAAPAAQASAAATQEFTYAYQNGGKVTKLYMDAEETVDLKFVGVKNYADKKSDLTTNWVSYPKSVATVDKNGVVTAVAEGEAIVYLEITDKTGEVTYTSTAVDVVVGKELAPVKLGTSKNDLADIDTVYELAIGDAVDLAFFGVPNYNKTNYTVTWVAVEDVLADEVVEAAAVQVDQKGVVVAVAEGEADVMALIVDNMTGEVLAAEWVNFLVVAAAEPTEEPTPEVTEAPEVTETPEPTEEPTPEVTEAPVASVEVKQTTENDLVLTFTGVDITNLTKEDIEIYEYFEDGEIQEYVWQFYGFANANVEAGTVEIVGYDTDEFVDGAKYAVRYVDVKDEGTAEERSEVIAETTFVASVGEVTDMNVWYASYLHNNGWWQFYDHAYTNASSGEEIQTKVFFALYDANGIDVTGHYQREAGTDSLINLELLNEDVDAYVDVEEADDTITFLDIPENPAIRFEVVYNDFEADNEVKKVLPMVIEQAPAYKIASIDDWGITLNQNEDGTWSFPQTWVEYNKKDIALYDDYDQTANIELLNHELVIWFTDNYGNKYVTNSKFTEPWGQYYWFSPSANGTYYDIATSEKFNGEGFELRYESRNPQILVVGDDEIDGAVNSSIITTKKTGTASVNVTLYNTFEEELASRLGVIRVTVKPERYIKNVNANSIALTTDSKPDGAPVDKIGNDNNDGDQYDWRFTSGDVEAKVLDQYGEPWGLYNISLINTLALEAVDTNKEAADETAWFLDYGAMAYYHTFDGVKLFEQVGKEPSVSYKLTATDNIHEDEEDAIFRISLKYPTENDAHELQCKSKFKLSAGNATYTNSKLKTTIKVEEISNNGYAVNYADGITLITSAAQYNALFTRKSVSASEGALYLVVYNPEKAIVDAASGSSLGIKTDESGLYTFQIGNAYGGNRCTEFVKAGNYVVKLLEVTSVDNNGKVNTFTTTTTKFTVTDDRIDIDFENQKEVYISDETNNWGYYYAVNEGIVGIARYAIQYSYNGSEVQFARWFNNIDSVSGVRFKQNERAKQVVVNDVFIKVMIDVDKNGNTDNDVAFYYVEVPVDKTFTLEDMGLIGNYDTVPNRLDPDGNRMQ